MKDLFCLVNAFMNRAKTEEQPNQLHQVSSESLLEVPFEAAEDVRVLPGASSSSNARKNTMLLTSLEPFLHLLPDLSGVELKDQRVLHKALYSAGVSAALSLHKFIYDSPEASKEVGTNNSSFSLSDIDREGADWKEIFNHLGKFIALEDSAETLRKMSYNVDELVRHEGGGQSLMKMISNEVAAAALAAFASATLRRPPTKVVESLMAASQETGPTSTDEENGCVGNEYGRALREPSLMPTQPHPHEVIPPVDGSKPVRSPLDNNHKVNPTSNSRSSSISALAGDERGELEEECDCDAEYEEIDDEDCLFRYVCAAGYEDLAKLLVGMRNSTEFAQRSESTPLMEACCGGHADVVRSLIAAGANVNVLSSTQNTALIYASASGHFGCVKELLKSGQCDLTIRNENGHCALMEAASIGNVDIIKILVEHGATPLSVVDNMDFKESALTLAAYKGHVAAVEYLISVMPENADREEEFHTALMEASMDGHVEVARALLNAGAPVNLPSDSFESPLTLASCGGHTELVALLIDFEADMEEPNDEGYTPLMEASREGHRDVVELLLDRGANVNARIDEGVETPLTLAASGGFKSVVELLVARGGDLTIGERTPLYEATQEGHIDVVEFIVQHLHQTGTPSEVLKDLNSALICAAEINNVAICNFLIENGAQIECFSQEGRTPLMEAAKQGNMLVLELLIHKGAQVNTVSSGTDCTALSASASNGHADVVRYLLERGADPHQILKDSSTCLLDASKNGHTNCVEILLDYNVPRPPPPSLLQTNQMDLPIIRDKKSGKLANGVLKAELSAQSKLAGGVAKPIRPKAKSFTQKECQSVISSVDNSRQAPALNAFNPLQQPIQPPSTGQAPAKVPAVASTLPLSEFAKLSQQQQQELCQAATLEMQLQKGGGTATSKSSQTTTSSSTSSLSNNTVDLTSGSSASTTPNASQLFRALASAASSSPYNGPDDWLFAQFIQRSLLTTKRRENMTEEEVRTFTEKIQHQFRAIFPSGQVDAAALGSPASQQALNNIYTAAALAESDGINEVPPPQIESIPQEGKAMNETSTEVVLSDGSPSPPTVVCCQQAASKATAKRPAKPGASAGPKASSVLPAGSKQKDEKITPSELSNKIAESTELIQARLAALALPMDPSSEAGMPAPLPAPIYHKEVQQEVQDMQPPPVPPFEPLNYLPQPRGRRTNPSSTQTSGLPHRCRNNHSGGAVKRSSSNTAPATQNSGVKTVESTFVDMQTETNHDTALTLACVGGHTSLVILLIKRGADIEHRDKKGFTPLILAATGGHLDACRALVEAGCQVDAQADRTKDTALSLACSGGRKEVVDLLLKAGANKEHRNISDYTPLSLAASGGYVEIIQMLLNNGAEINSRTGSKLGISPLMLSAMNGHENATLLLLENGSDINAQIETNRNTALTLACFQGRTEVVRLLLQFGANVEHRAKTGLTPLMEAANGGYVEVGSLLLEANADANASPVPTSRDTGLTIAADKGHAAFVELLIHAGAQVNVRNKKGCSALWLACSGGQLETVQTLVKHNADTDAQDNRKVSPLMIAFRKGHFKIVKYIVRHVAQFPSDQECNRYIATLIDQDLIAKCRQCIDFIIAAKAKQAEEANKAAESLLELLAQEEAMAESKKRTKQRQKEKKKAKKNAKKQVCLPFNQTDDDNDAAATREDNDPADNRQSSSSPSFAEDNKQPIVEVIATSSLDIQPAPELVVIEEEEDEADKIRPQLNAAIINSAADNDMRVPLLEVTSSKQTTTVLPSNASMTQANAATHSRPSRRQPRRSSGKVTSASSGVRGSNAAANGRLSNSEEEWLRASKKKATALAKVDTSKANKPSKSFPSAQEDGLETWSGSLDATAAPARRRSHVLAVCSSAIARVIGRAGSNINAIREATSAHIEVEKMTTRREQASRQITIKGTPEAIKSAVWMIEMLIKENDTHINEIINYAMGVQQPPATTYTDALQMRFSPENVPLASITPTPLIEEPTKMNHTPVGPNSEAVAVTGKSSSSKNSANCAQSANGGAVGNVWQQRAAIREMQTQKKEPLHMTPQPLHEVKVFQLASPSAKVQLTKPSLNPDLVSVVRQKEKEEEIMVDSTLLSQELAQEEHQRKAPGYARPHSSSAQHCSPTALNGVAEESDTYKPTSKESQVTCHSPIEQVAVMKPIQSAAVGAELPPKAAKSRPLSDIWENTCSADPLSPPTLNLTGLFGNAGDSKTSLWLPSLLSKTHPPKGVKGPEEKAIVEGGWPSLVAPTSENGPFTSFSAEKAVNWENLTSSATSNSSSNWTPSAIGAMSSISAAQWGAVDTNKTSKNSGSSLFTQPIPAMAVQRPMSSNNEYHPNMAHSKKMAGQSVEGMRQVNTFARAVPLPQQGQQINSSSSSNNSTSMMFNGGAATQPFDNSMNASNAASANSTVIKSYLDSMQQASTNEFRMPKGMHDFQNNHMPAQHPIHNNHASNQGESIHSFQLNQAQMAAAAVGGGILSQSQGLPANHAYLQHPHQQQMARQMPHFYSSSGQPHLSQPFVHPPPGFGQPPRQMSASVSGMHGGGGQQSFFNSNIPPPIGSRPRPLPVNNFPSAVATTVGGMANNHGYYNAATGWTAPIGRPQNMKPMEKQNQQQETWSWGI